MPDVGYLPLELGGRSRNVAGGPVGHDRYDRGGGREGLRGGCPDTIDGSRVVGTHAVVVDCLGHEVAYDLPECACVLLPDVENVHPIGGGGTAIAGSVVDAHGRGVAAGTGDVSVVGSRGGGHAGGGRGSDDGGRSRDRHLENDLVYVVRGVGRADDVVGRVQVGQVAVVVVIVDHEGHGEVARNGGGAGDGAVTGVELKAAGKVEGSVVDYLGGTEGGEIIGEGLPRDRRGGERTGDDPGACYGGVADEGGPGFLVVVACLQPVGGASRRGDAHFVHQPLEFAAGLVLPDEQVVVHSGGDDLVARARITLLGAIDVELHLVDVVRAGWKYPGYVMPTVIGNVRAGYASSSVYFYAQFAPVRAENPLLASRVIPPGHDGGSGFWRLDPTRHGTWVGARDALVPSGLGVIVGGTVETGGGADLPGGLDYGTGGHGVVGELGGVHETTRHQFGEVPSCRKPVGPSGTVGGVCGRGQFLWIAPSRGDRG